MHLKKVTKTVDYYSYGLSSDAGSERALFSAARRRSLRAEPEQGTLAKGARGRPRGPQPQGGARTPSNSVPRGWAREAQGAGPESTRPPRPGRALGTRECGRGA